MSDQKQIDVSNSKLEFYSRPARKFWTFWRIFTDVKTSVWALTETLLTRNTLLHSSSTPLFISILPPSLFVCVHSGPLLSIIWWSHSLALRQCRLVHFLWLIQKPGMDFQ